MHHADSDSDDTLDLPRGPRHRADPAETQALPDIPGYAVERRIAIGGMGSVYQARKQFPSLGGEVKVAVKVLNEFRADDVGVKQFLDECRILMSLQEVPAIARVLDAGVFKDRGIQRPFLAMEYIPGERTLADCIRENKPSRRQLLAMMAKVCGALHQVHMRGVCHLDMKPGNILVDPADDPKVIDFGIARTQRSTSRPGAITGTPEYMAPEQVAPQTAPDARSDVYSLGVILYEVLTGRRPFIINRSSPARMAASIVESVALKPLRFRGVRCPARLEAVVMRALHKDPTKRQQTALELAGDLRRYLADTDGLVKRPHRRSLACGLIAAILCIGVWKLAVEPRADRFRGGNYAHWLMLNFPREKPAQMETRVRVVAFDDQTDFEHLAELHGIKDVHEAPWSRRRVFAAALEKLVGVGARAVAIDLNFSSVAEAASQDEDLARAITHLSTSGTPVILGCRDCDLRASGLPNLSEEIVLAAGRWGDVDLEPDSWFMPLVIQREAKSQNLSFGLGFATFLAATGNPAATPKGYYDVPRATVVYWWETTAGAAPGSTIRIGAERSLTLANARPRSPDGSGRTDLVIEALDVAPREILDAITVRLDDVLGATPEKLGEWFFDRVVLLGTLRSDAPDSFVHPRGENIHGVFAHATVIDQLLTNGFPRIRRELWWLIFIPACLTAVMFAGVRHSRWLVALGVALLAPAFAGAALLIYSMYGLILDVPGMVIVVLGVGMCAIGWISWSIRHISLAD